MPSQSDDKYVSDVISCDILVKNYFLFICAGVGAGKSRWAKNLAQGKTLGQETPLKVLFLTSRTIAKAELLSANDLFSSKLSTKGNYYIDAEEYFSYFMWGGDDLPEDRLATLEAYEVDDFRFNAPVAQTYAAFSSFISYVYFDTPEENCYAWIWQMFDVLVLDESHTIWLEANFQKSGHTVVNLIKWINEHQSEYPDKRVVFMSGTPDFAIENLRKIGLKIKILDLRRKCKCVKPSKIMFMEEQDKYSFIEDEILFEGVKVIDFYNGAARSLREIRALLKYTPYEDMLCLVSKWSKAREIWDNESFFFDEYKDTLARMTEAEEYMVGLGEDTNKPRNRLPDQYYYIASTSAFSEAVSWQNEDIGYMFVDSHLPERVIQCAGRLRKADYTLVVVTDAYQYEDKLQDSLLAIKNNIKNIDEYNNEYEYLKTPEARKDFIETTEATEEGIVFDFMEGCFVPYEMALSSIIYQQKQLAKWNAVDAKKLNCYSGLVERWFPDVPTEKYRSRPYQSFKLLKDNKVKLGQHYTAQKIDTLLKKLQDIWGEPTKNTVNAYLKMFWPERTFEKIYRGPHKDEYRFIQKK